MSLKSRLAAVPKAGTRPIAGAGSEFGPPAEADRPARAGTAARAARLLAVPAIAAPFALAMGLPAANAADASTKCAVAYTTSTATATCAYTGGPQIFTFPAGVSSVTATADGASGGMIDGIASGGSGGETEGVLAMAPGTVLTVIVGAAGAFGGGATFGGGGAPGHGGIPAASGGGGSFVQTVDGVTLLVAGGGGGAANWSCGSFGAANGGYGGGSVGGRGSTTCPSAAGGPGGGQSDASGVGQGGSGQDATGSFGSPGGGGGGGYNGGEGGRVVAAPPASALGGGGGGGSGYCAPDLDCTLASGRNSGNGLVTFTWAVSTARITTDDTATFTVAAQGQFTVAAAGVPMPELSLSGDRPEGLILTDNRDGTATISGTPAAGAAGEYSIDVTAHNPAGDDTQTLTITVDPITPTVAVTADPPAVSDPGQPVALAADIAGEAGPAAGGTVLFTANGIVIAGCEAAPVHEGMATCRASDLPAGQVSIAAAYTGDPGTYRAAKAASSVVLADTAVPVTTPVTTAPTTTAPTTTDPTPPAADPTPPETVAATLPATGGAPGAAALAGLTLVLVGAGLARTGRRRRQH